MWIQKPFVCCRSHRTQSCVHNSLADYALRNEEQHTHTRHRKQTQSRVKKEQNETNERRKVNTIYLRIEVVHKVWLTWRPRRENCENVQRQHDAKCVRLNRQASVRTIHTFLPADVTAVCAHGELVTGRWIYLLSVCTPTTTHSIPVFFYLVSLLSFVWLFFARILLLFSRELVPVRELKTNEYDKRCLKMKIKLLFLYLTTIFMINIGRDCEPTDSHMVRRPLWGREMYANSVYMQTIRGHSRSSVSRSLLPGFTFAESAKMACCDLRGFAKIYTADMSASHAQHILIVRYLNGAFEHIFHACSRSAGKNVSHIWIILRTSQFAAISRDGVDSFFIAGRCNLSTTTKARKEISCKCLSSQTNRPINCSHN